MKLSDYITSRLEEYVKHIFLISGGGCIHLVDSLSKSKIKMIPNLHEQASSICAESYSQYTNNIGVALVTTGPGATNALTGVSSAWLDSIPILLITGQVQNKDRVGNRNVRQYGFQEIDTVSIYKSVTKYAVTITDPTTIRYHFEKAIWLAKNGRPGPVLLDIPLDIQAAQINENELIGFEPKTVTYNFDNIKDIADALSNAKRPIVLVGNGVRLSNGVEEFYKFISKTKIPVLTTWKALDLLAEDHPQYVGRPGGVGQRGANFNQQNSDFILVIGARLDHGQLGYQPQYFAREAIRCIVDIDINEINKLGIHVHYPINMDAKLFLSELNNNIDSKIDFSDWLIHCKKLYEKYPVILDEYLDTKKETVSNYAFIKYLSDLLPEGSLLVPGSSGACSEVTMQAFQTKKETRVYNSEGLGSMGFAIPSAIAAAIASGKETISIDGDGGFFMNIQELELVSRYKLPIKFFVLNNNGYGSIKTTQNTHFNGRLVVSDPSSGLTLPSIELNTIAYGLKYMKINNQKDLKTDIANILKQEGPVVCEIMVDQNHKTLPKVSVYKKEDGSFATRPMEDLTPFLDRDEFNKNLLVKPINYEII